MRCENCNKIIPESIGECIYCNEGIQEVYDNETEVCQHETTMD